MALVWKHEKRLRADPYLDWEFRTRSPVEAGENNLRWCALLVDVRCDDHEDYLLALKGLAAALERGQIEGDKAEAGIVTLIMSGDERRMLESLIKDLETRGAEIDQTTTAGQFILYRPEMLVYCEGGYAETPYYKVLHAGLSISDDLINHRPLRVVSAPSESAVAAGTVAIGIIDDGLGFAHRRFRTQQNTTRFGGLWIQDGIAEDGTTDVVIGRRFDPSTINQFLKDHETEAEVYRACGMLDYTRANHKSLASRLTHGTHVLDLATGGEPTEDLGLRPIFGVQLPASATADTSGLSMGLYVLQGVRQIMHWADALGPETPLVINFSYGIFAGPKDGTHPLEQALACLVESRNRRGAPTVMVLPAGNGYRARTTAVMKLAENGAASIDWVILPDDRTASFLEIWLDGDDLPENACAIELTIQPPGGLASLTVKVPLDTMAVLGCYEHQAVAGIYADQKQSAHGKRQSMVIAINPSTSLERGGGLAPHGRWSLTLANATREAISAHLYIQRDDTPSGFPLRGRQSYFDHADAYGRDVATGAYVRFGSECPLTHEETLSAIATGQGSVVVGAVQANASLRPSEYTSSGPTPGRRMPDAAAIADEGFAHRGVMAAGTYTGSSVMMRGTSVAAPQIARAIADAWAQGGAVVADNGAVAVKSTVQLGNAAFLPATQTVVLPIESQTRLGPFMVSQVPPSHLPPRRYPA